MPGIGTKLAVANFKLAVQAYTWTTLPFYTLAQRPWQKVRMSRNTGIIKQTDSYGRTVYTRNCRKSDTEINEPLLTKFTLNDMIPLLDRSMKKVGIRQVLNEIPQLDPNGEPIKVEGKEFKKIQLADKYTWYTVGTLLDKVDLIAKGLHSIGVRSGVNTLLYAENSLTWYCTGLSLQRLNAVTVTLLSILNDEGIAYGINQSESKFILTSQELLVRLARLKLDASMKIVYTPNQLDPSNPKAMKAIESLKARGIEMFTIDQIEQLGAGVKNFEFVSPNPKDVTLIMYTSGTTGNPKGVMITHEQMMTSLHNIKRMDSENERPMMGGATRYSAYLPMAHLYGYLLNIGMLLSPSLIAMANPMTLFDNSPAHTPGQPGDFTLFKPTFLGAVPLVLERILKEINAKLEAQGPAAPLLFHYLMDYKIRWRQRGYSTPLINRLVCKKIKQQFGGNFALMLVGSAPLSPRTQALIQAALDIDLVQAYGSTELLGACHGTKTWDLDYGHCGVPVQGVKMRLEDWSEGGYSTTDEPNPRGEIVIAGPTLACGYFRMPEETDKVFSTDPDGTRWYNTGDIGEILPDGRLKIIDRKSDLTKLANAEFVSLGRIESILRSVKYVENLCLCTRPERNELGVLVSPNRKALLELAAEFNLTNESIESLCENEKIKSKVLTAMQRSAKALGLMKIETPRAICLVAEEWNQDNNLLTAAFKMRRRPVNEFYKEKINKMFESMPSK